MKSNYTILLGHFRLFQNGLTELLTTLPLCILQPRYIYVFLNKILNSCFYNFKLIFLRMYFSSVATFSVKMAINLHLKFVSLGFNSYH